METITIRELINFFGECDDLRMSSGEHCSFDINYPKNQFEISWGRNYELMDHDHLEVFPFDNNQNIPITDKGVVTLNTNDNIKLFFVFTKTLTMRDFR